MIAYRAMRDVPRELAQYVSRLLHVERHQRGTRKNSRALTCLRKRCWVAVVPPGCRGHALAQADGLAYVILDGKIFSADRCGEKTMSVKGKQIDLWYPGKAHEHGGNIQTVMEPDGFPLWMADVEPGSVHDLTAARDYVLVAFQVSRPCSKWVRTSAAVTMSPICWGWR